jgi:hypothetical protein
VLELTQRDGGFITEVVRGFHRGREESIKAIMVFTRCLSQRWGGVFTEEERK